MGLWVTLAMPLVLGFCLAAGWAFLAVLVEPLNFLFFCLWLEATRGIVDIIIKRIQDNIKNNIVFPTISCIIIINIAIEFCRS